VDLVNSAIQFKQAAVMSQVQYAVAAKMLNSQKQQGNAVLNMLNAAAVNVNNAGSQMVAAATGTGGSLDTYA